ncbi:MAG: FAD binding domain-containing protein [Oligoflexia bacterium]|nr:FAD binding domain-containing protein [Oligoflexia bacterium]
MSSRRSPGLSRKNVVFYLNRQRQEVGVDKAGMMLADYLRLERALTGTKIVCAEGDCGACSVLRAFPLSGSLFLPINSCVIRVAQLDGSSIVTVDGLRDGKLTPIQDAIVRCHGSQCGYCTPGFVITLTGLVEKRLRSDASRARLEPKEIKNALTGNLCRCTGYQPIVEAAVSVPLSECVSLEERFFPKTRQTELRKILKTPLALASPEPGGFSLHAPTRLADAARLLARDPDARLIGAGTDLGVLHNKGKSGGGTRFVSLHLIPELYRIRRSGRGRLWVGARVTLSELRTALKNRIPEFARFLDLFASPQIKNVATLIGNVGNASPIADTPPFLLVARATVRLLGPKGGRSVPLEEFYLGYRQTAARRGELILAIEFDLPSASERLALYKVSQRKDLDISGVNAAFRVKKGARGTQAIQEIRIAMGGVAAVPLRLRKTESFLAGKALDPETARQALEILQSEINPISDLRGSAAYRRVLAENLFLRFAREQSGESRP